MLGPTPPRRDNYDGVSPGGDSEICCAACRVGKNRLPVGPGPRDVRRPTRHIVAGSRDRTCTGFPPADFEADSGSDAAGAPRQLSCVRNGLQSVRGCRSDAIRRGRPTGTRREHGESPRPVVGVHPPDAPTWDVRHRATERTQCKPSPPDPRPSPWHGDMLDAALRRTRR
jgi:hypothetical protein